MIWVSTLITIGVVYSTLAVAETVSDLLRQRGVLDAFFMIGFVLIVAAVATNGLRNRPKWIELVVALGFAGVLFMLMARLGIPEERTHLFEYAFVALLVHQGLEERRNNGRPIRHSASLAVVAAAALGWLDEGIQAMLPNRVYDLQDVAFNAAAALFAVAASEVPAWVRRMIDRLGL